MRALADRRAITFATIVALLIALGLVVANSAPASATDERIISGLIDLPDGSPADNMAAVHVIILDGVGAPVTGVLPASDGSWSVTGLAPGIYTMEATIGAYSPGGGPLYTPPIARAYYPGQFLATDATPIDVTSGNATGIFVALEWSGSISGTVSLPSDVDSVFLSTTNVRAYDSLDRVVLSASVNDADGTYQLAGLPIGEYRVDFVTGQYYDGTLHDSHLLQQYYNDTYVLSKATPVSVTQGATATGVNAVMSAVGHFSTTPTPVISSVALNAGSSLGVSLGTWVPSAAWTFQWKRNGSNISGATHTTYTIAPSDRGTSITVTVKGTRASFTSVSKTSAPVAIPLVFTRTVTPTITGTAKSGYTLTAHRGTWSPATTSNSYQWKQDGGIIDGATHSTYKVTTADRGHDITVTVTGKRSGYLSTSKTSAPLRIAKAFTTTVTPTITGTAKSGHTLTAHRGTWSPTASYSYRWYRNGTAISGATHSTYRLTSSDKGKKITVKVTGKRTGYTTVTKTSASKTIAK